MTGNPIQREPDSRQVHDDRVMVVPRRQNFLDRIHFDLTNLQNDAGGVTRGEFSVNLRPITFGIAAGQLRLNYMPEGTFFVGPRTSLELETGRTQIFGNIGFGYLAGSETNRTQLRESFQTTASAGITYDLIRARTRTAPNLRLGLDLGGTAEGSGPFGVSYQGQFNFGAGVALSLGPITAFGTVRSNVATEMARNQSWTDIRPYYLEAEGGVIAEIGPTRVSARYRNTRFSNEFRLEGELTRGVFRPNIGLVARENHGPFGENFEFILSAGFEFGRTGQFRARTETTITEHQIRRPVSEFRHGMYETEWEMYSAIADLYVARPLTGSITPEEESRRRNLLRSELGYSIETHINIMRSVYENARRHPEDMITPNIALDVLRQSDSLDELVNRLHRLGTNDQIKAIAIITGIVGVFYDEQTRSASVFSDQRAELGNLTPEETYRRLRESFVRGEMIPNGICATINAFAVELLNRLGFEAYGLSVPSGGAAHYIGIARDQGGNTYLFNYQDVRVSNTGSFIDLIADYARRSRTTIQGIYIYGRDQRIIGRYEGPFEELTREVSGDIQREQFRRMIIRRRGEESH